MIRGWTEVYRLLDKHRAALCIHDMPVRRRLIRRTMLAFIYMRRHGTAEGRYAGSYSEEQSNTMPTHTRVARRRVSPCTSTTTTTSAAMHFGTPASFGI